MGEYEHFVFMPKGKDTCPRILIEAKISGMNTHVNLNCQHTSEKWWTSPEEVENYLRDHPQNTFYKAIKNSMEKIETIELTIKDEEDGVFAISLVETPASMEDFVAL